MLAKAGLIANIAGMEDFAIKLAAAMDRIVGGAAPIEGPTRLSGGANMESWSFDRDGQGYVLRRAPSAEMMEGRAFGHDVEAALVRAARAAGVLAPEVVGELVAGDGLGSGYIMRRVEAEVNPATILAAPSPVLIDDIARELAHVHRIEPTTAIAIPHMEPCAALADLEARFHSYGGDRPVIALALRWCADNVPSAVEPVLVHGDFRLGNLMANDDGLAAVLDWELAHWGDAHEDLAYACMAVWRFGCYDRPAFGLADLETYFSAYERHGGRTVNRPRFRFWLVYRTLWWALGCLQMADIWRSGADRTLERAVIGRRTSENELDLLLLLEEDAPLGERAKVTLPEHATVAETGEPSSLELVEAVRDWIANDVKAKAEGRDRFMAAVAMNALAIAMRELSNPAGARDAELATGLLDGTVTLAAPGILLRLRKDMLAKVTTDSPKYASLAAARELWLDA